MLLNQTIVLVTGHICAGKSTVYKYLSEQLNIQKIDIAKVHGESKKECSIEDLFISNKKFFNEEPRLYYLCSEILDALYSQRSVYVEVLGEELWFPKFKKTLSSLWVPLIEIELKRETLECALECLKQRHLGAKGAQLDLPTYKLQNYEAESVFLSDHFGQIFNQDAKKFTTNQKNAKQIANYLINKMKGKKENGNY